MNSNILTIPPCCFPKHLNLIFEEADRTLRLIDTYEADLLFEPDVFLSKLLPEFAFELPHSTLTLRLRTIPEDLTQAVSVLASRPYVRIAAPTVPLLAATDIKRIRKKDTPELLTLTSDLPSRRGTPISITLQGDLSTPLTPKMRKVQLTVRRVPSTAPHHRS